MDKQPGSEVVHHPELLCALDMHAGPAATTPTAGVGTTGTATPGATGGAATVLPAPAVPIIGVAAGEQCHCVILCPRILQSCVIASVC